MTVLPAHTEKLTLRLTPADKRKLRLAAAAVQCSVPDFVLASALSCADKTLVDRQHFGLSEQQWQAFHHALDAPARELPRLEVLFATSGVFDQSGASK
jgi:uncharacterized protein (DUF1778 family)